MIDKRQKLAFQRKKNLNYHKMYEKALYFIKIKEAQIKVTVLNLYIPIRIGEIRNIDNTKLLQGYVASRTFICS